MTAFARPDHSLCSIHDPCELGTPSSCPRQPDRDRRALAKRGSWSALELRREPGGPRHYLDGKPVHCGAGLELQHTTLKTDDYGDFTVPLQVGTVVRYEASLRPSITWSLHAGVGGHEFAAVGEPWLRFRWPKQAWEKR